MALENYETGKVLHSTDETVTTAEIILKGIVSVYIGGQKMILTQGSLIGLQETPQEKYNFTYTAEEPVQVYTYPFLEETSIQRIVENNAKIAPALAAKAVRDTLNAFNVYDTFYESVSREFEKLHAQIADYPVQCKKAGVQQKMFPGLLEITAPERNDLLQDWQINFLEFMKENEKKFMMNFYSADTSVSAGTLLIMYELQSKIENGIISLEQDLRGILQESEEFRSEIKLLEMKLNALKQTMQMSGEDQDGEVPLIKNAMDIILSYSDIDKNKALKIKELVKQYKELPDRRSITDSVRFIRKQLIDGFYELYPACFLKSRENPMNIPAEVRMFLLFGFFDEELAGADNTEIMYRIITSYRPDEEGHVFTLYQWLTMIQNGTVVPSRNEFEQDYEAYMHEQKLRGDITDQEYAEKIDDSKSKLTYEINNLFKMGNRMTFGKISSYQPFFDSCNVLMDLKNSYMSATKVNDAINTIISIDKSIFRREREYRNEELGLKNIFVHVEVIPNIILLPNVGTRAALWQEIEGKKRDSKARMIMPIFLAEDMTKAFTALCGEYRWEITKTEQGVHWNDLKDLSLTSEYNDYIQFYKKNREFNTEQREKIKKQIQKAGSNLRRTFVSDYCVYINSESNGSPLMNRVARGILFTYCPFALSYRERIKTSPIYANELNKFEIKMKEKAHPILNIAKKLENQGIDLPKALSDEIEYIKS